MEKLYMGLTEMSPRRCIEESYLQGGLVRTLRLQADLGMCLHQPEVALMKENIQWNHKNFLLFGKIIKKYIAMFFKKFTNPSLTTQKKREL